MKRTLLSLSLLFFVACAEDSLKPDRFEQIDCLKTLDELSSFTVDINTSPLSEKEFIPKKGNMEFFAEYIENNFDEKNVTSIRFNGIDETTVKGLASGDSIKVKNGHVEFYSHTKGLTLEVSGKTVDGSLKVYSDKKFCLKFCDVSITNPHGSAINIQDGNCFIVLEGTNNLSDGADAEYTHPKGEDEKAVLFSNDDLRFSGNGILNVTANNKKGKECISSDDAIFIRPNINCHLVSGAKAGHGMKANDAIVIKGGVLNIETAGDGCKGISSDGNLIIDGGRTTIVTTGSVDSLDLSDPVGCAAIKCDSLLEIRSGELFLKSTGLGGKGISGDKTISISGGLVNIITEGEMYGSNKDQGRPDGPPPERPDGEGHRPDKPDMNGGIGDRKTDTSISVSPKGIRCDGDITISGGNICVRTSGTNAEGIESKTVITFTGGSTAALTCDDGFNGKTINISGGRAFAMSTGICDGIDSNGSINATGGILIGVGGNRRTNDGIDLQDTLTVRNATILGIAMEGLSEGYIDGPYVQTEFSGPKGQYMSLFNGDKPQLTFFLPKAYETGRILVSTPAMDSGTYTINPIDTPSNGKLWMNYLGD